MSLRAGALLFALGFVVQPEPAAWAQTAPATAPEAATGAVSTASCAVAEGSREVAEFFRSFECSFEAGDYPSSLKVLERACNLHDAAECSFNFGLIHNTLYERGAAAEHCSLALGYYRQYLTRDPYGEGRDDVLLALGELEQSCEPPSTPASVAAAPAPPTAPAPGVVIKPRTPGFEVGAPARPELPQGAISDAVARHDAPQAPRAPSRVLPFTLLGAGATVGVLALVSGSAAWRAHDDIQERARRDGGDQNKLAKASEAHQLVDNRGHHQTLAWVFGLGSIGLLGAGATLLILDSGDEAALSFGSGGLPGLTYSTGF